MDNKILQLIKETKNDQELDFLIRNKIAFENFMGDKGCTIGVDTDINPSNCLYDGSNNDDYMYDESYMEWDGYMPLGTKIIYSTCYSWDKYASYNAGGYYYLDDEDYIREFVYSIKDEDITNLETLVNYIHSYLCYKFEKNINSRDRLDIHKLIYKSEGRFFNPIKEHSIKDFYHNGSAMCTEKSAMGQNILSFFDINVRFIITGTHVFQLVKYGEDYYVLDFSKTAVVVDKDLNFIDKVPYFTKIGPLSEDWLYRFSYGDEEIRLKEYFILNIGKKFIKMETSIDRVYVVSFDMDRKEYSNVGSIKINKGM